MRPYLENFLFKRSVHPAHFILGGFGKKQRGIGSLAGGGGGNCRVGAPEVGCGRWGVQAEGWPHIRVSVSVVKSREGDLQPRVPESRGFLLLGWRERGLRGDVESEVHF